jgi:hypothetical protein
MAAGIADRGGVPHPAVFSALDGTFSILFGAAARAYLTVNGSRDGKHLDRI